MKMLLVQTAVGDYRQACLNEVVQRAGDGFNLLCGREYFYPSTKTGVDIGERMKFVPNHFLLGRRLLWQSGVIRYAIAADSLILEFNPRILSNWVIVFARKLLKRRTAFWGHAWSRAGRSAKTGGLRRLFRNLSDVLVVYTEQQKNEVLDEGSYQGVVIAAPNALYRRSQMQAVTSSSLARRSFLYVGRLVRDKQPQRLLEAFADFKNSTGKDVFLRFVGDGPLKQELAARASALGVNDCVYFEGHVSDPIRLRAFYEEALASVSPGYVGLSITQSFGFGVPMVISEFEQHAPEIEAAVVGVNCLFFDARRADSLSGALSSLWDDRELWCARSERIAEVCRERYSAEVMASRLVSAFDACREASI